MFETSIVKDFYDFQWYTYAKDIHFFGAVIHSIYFMLFVVYTNEVYLHRNYEARVPMLWIMFMCIIYPMFYDCLQLIK